MTITENTLPRFVNDPALQEVLLGIYERLGKLEVNLEVVNDNVDDLINTVRGHNGNLGLVTDVTLLKDVVNRSNGAKPMAKEAPAKDTHITFAWVVDRLVAPVVTAITTAVVLYFLLKGG